MKCKWKGILRCLLGAGVIAAIFALALGQRAEDPQAMKPVRLSHPSGFYDGAFDLELSCEGGGEIRYTLDATPPDESSPLYTGPIRIADASANDNVYSLIEDVCVEYDRDLLADVGIEPKYGFTVPTLKLDKATVVRAVCYDAFGNRSDVVDAVYFVGFDQKPAYDGLNVVAITTDPANLFDYEKGIYVLGKSFGDTLVDGRLMPPVSANLGNWPANYKNKGPEWERRASVCIFNAERELVLSGDYGIRIQGGASRFMLPKSLNLYARRRYGSETIPAQALFGEDWQLQTLNLNSGGQGVTTKIHDPLVNALVGDMNVLTREYEPCALFLDGEFWGVYWLTPRFKEDYFKNKYGVEDFDIIETKVDYIEVGTDEDFNVYKSLLRLIGDNDLSDSAMYAAVCDRIDVDSWIDYYAIEIYIANADWPKNNRSIWRTRAAGEGQKDGRWRWVLFDTNMAMAPISAREDYVERTESMDAMFASLMDNPGFASAIREKLAWLAQNCFNPARVDAFIDAYERDMAAAMANEYARFINTRTEQDFIDDCEAIRQFFRDRHDYIMENYGEKQK